jgi:hypothetical protein
MLQAGRAQAVHADRVTFGQTARHRFLKRQTPGIPIWEFAAKGGNK